MAAVIVSRVNNFNGTKLKVHLDIATSGGILGNRCSWLRSRVLQRQLSWRNGDVQRVRDVSDLLPLGERALALSHA